MKKEHFKIESLQTILKVIQPRHWHLSVNLKDAYFRVPFAPHFQRFLKFSIGPLQYQFVCLPFSLTTSPRVFSKVLLVVVVQLRRCRICIHHYLDDILLMDQDRGKLLSHHNPSTAQVTHKLGEEPIRYIPATGLPGRSAGHMEKYSVPTTREDFPYRAKSARSAYCLPAKTCLRLLGTITSVMPMVKWAQWHARPFRYGFLRQWHSQNLYQNISLTQSMRQSLAWWEDKRNLMQCHSLLPTSWIVITSDASKS